MSRKLAQSWQSCAERAALASAGTACKPYAALFEEGAWKELAELFRKDLYRLHSMPLESQLSIHLQVIN